MSFEGFNEGDLIRVNVKWLVPRGRASECIYCYLREKQYLGGTDKLLSVTVDQIIGIENQLNDNNRPVTTVPRVIFLDRIGGIGIQRGDLTDR